MDSIASMKKIDLHCHLDGSLSENAIRLMARSAGVPLPQDAHQLSQRLRAGDETSSLAEYLEHFDLPIACLVTEDNLEQAALDLMRQAAGENVIYLEMRFAPLLSVRPELNCHQVIASVICGIEKGQAQYGIWGNAILCGLRNDSTENNIAMLTVGREFLGHGVCAADLAGDEASYPVMGQRAFFEAARKLGIPYTVHAGECGSSESIRDALSLGAKRIGHGIAMRKDPAVRELCRRAGAGVELCPCSNMQTKAISGWAEYPLRLFLDEGLKATVNTDNRTVSNTTITHELNMLREHLGFTEPDFALLMKNAVEIAFLDDSKKTSLFKKLEI